MLVRYFESFIRAELKFRPTPEIFAHSSKTEKSNTPKTMAIEDLLKLDLYSPLLSEIQFAAGFGANIGKYYTGI